MPEPSQAARRAQLARAERQVIRHPDQPAHAALVLELRREYAAEKLVAYVAEVVGQAPPLTPVQRDRIAVLLRGGAR